MSYKKYIIVNERISNGYYTYKIHLLDAVNKCNIDYEYYGDMQYWGIPNSEITFDEALRKLLCYYNIDKDDIEFINCGGHFQDSCSDEIIDMMFKSCYEV
ncbi:MAG: hypothetical protein QXR31_04450 [Zestosphaera sp.]